MDRKRLGRVDGLFPASLVLAIVLLAASAARANAHFESPAGARAASLSWVPPTTNDDGTTLHGLAGYRIYGGRDADHLTLIRELDHAGTTAFVVEQLDRGTHYFAVSSIARDGTESALSAVMTVTIR